MKSFSNPSGINLVSSSTLLNFVWILIIFNNCWLGVTGAEFHYGQHFPNGISAVNYIYGRNGTWKPFNTLNYVWNYYEQHATLDHPFDKGALISAANGSTYYTARDANGYLLCDSDYDLEINPEYCQDGSAAFHEHNGIKSKGIRSGAPFTQFWLDDNWLARFMSEAYRRPKPGGLVEQKGFLRWRVVGGDTKNWSPYNWEFFDTLALDGLYYLSRGEVSTALEQWDRSLNLSEARLNDTEMTFKYPGLHENYHVGLWKILTDMLLDHLEIPPEKNDILLQHSVSLRKEILRNQEIDNETGDYIGWISNIGSDSALINTESVSCCVLGLGANSKYVFEVSEMDTATNINNHNFFILTDNIKRRTFGPGFPLSPGNYKIEFILRAKNYKSFVAETKLGQVKIVDVTDLNMSNLNNQTNQSLIIASKLITNSDFKNKTEHWSKISLHCEVPLFLSNGSRLYDFIVEWDSYNEGLIEVSAVIVK